VNILRTGLDETVGQPSHVPHLIPLSVSVFLVVVSKHGGPGKLPLGHNLCEFGQDRLRVPRRSLAIQLIAGEDNKIRSFGIENFRKESRGKVVRAITWGEDRVATSAP